VEFECALPNRTPHWPGGRVRLWFALYKHSFASGIKSKRRRNEK